MGSLIGAETGREKGLYKNIDRLGGAVEEEFGGLESIGRVTGRVGKKALKHGRQDLEQVGEFFKTLLTGDKQAVTQTLSPEIEATRSQYDAAKRNLAEFAPRGGGQVSAIGNLQAGEASQIGNLYTGARQRGAEGLAGIGSALGSLGIASESLATESIGKVLQGLLSEQGIKLGELELAQGNAKRVQQGLGGIGSLIGDVIGFFI